MESLQKALDEVIAKKKEEDVLKEPKKLEIEGDLQVIESIKNSIA